jgi:predicted TIM-barrel fold metal-dependent hydrolase
MQAFVTRRSFLKLAYLSGAATAMGTLFPSKSQSTTNKLTPHRIDVHHHILPPEYVSALAGIGITDAGGVPFPSWSPQNSLNVMDRNGIATAITSISSPGVYFGDSAFSRNLARRCNEISANLANEYPKRFGAFAVLPLPDVKGALREMDYALDELKLDGIVLLTNFAGHYLGTPEFDDLFYELNRRKAVVYVHPAAPPAENLPKLRLPAALIEFPFDTTRAIVNLIYSGTFECCPDIRFIFSHAGGTTPYLTWRISLLDLAPGIQAKAPRGVITYLKLLYYDTALSATPYALRSLQELVDPSHIVFGSDYPFAPESVTSATVSGLKQYAGFDEKALKAIERDNALRLFARLSKG